MKKIILNFHHKFGSLTFYFFLLLIVILMFSLLRNLISLNKASQRIAEAQIKLDELKEEQTELESELAKLQSRSFIEKQIRDKLSLVAEGEIVLVLPEDEVVRKFSPYKPEKVEEFLPPPNWKAWLKLFL